MLPVKMDAYSMTFTSPTLRHVSRIYQDLRSIHFQSISGVTSIPLAKPQRAMAAKAKVSEEVCLSSGGVFEAVTDVVVAGKKWPSTASGSAP